MMTINQLSMAFGDKLLFYDVNLHLNSATHYALVGANGSGKSTLFRLLNGEETPLSGSIAITKDATVGWLKQDQFFYENTPIVEVVIRGKEALWQAMSEKEQLLQNTTWDDAMGLRLAELEETIAHWDGYSAASFAEKILLGLGIPLNYHPQPLKALSGGFKLRVLLAQTLFQNPHILLLDEPTNHLDILSIQWLERYLKNEFAGLVIFISHDVAFINGLADYILDIDYGEIRQYSGHYTQFLAEKKLIETQKLQLKKNLENRIADMQRFVDRFKAKATKARQAQSRMKMIEKIELPDIKQSSRIAPHFNFKQKAASGRQVLQVEKLAKGFQQKNLFKKLSFKVQRGEKIAIIGANGVGKSTLIKCLLQLIPADEGQVTWGHNVQISYFSQDHHDLLKQSMRVLDWLSEQVTQVPEQQLRKILAQVLFTKTEVEKDILLLSGGEAARLLLAKLMLEEGNVLILDEPTNHLDLETIDALAEALCLYSGTLIFVSHNRYFIDKIASRILLVDPEQGLVESKERAN